MHGLPTSNNNDRDWWRLQIKWLFRSLELQINAYPSFHMCIPLIKFSQKYTFGPYI